MFGAIETIRWGGIAPIRSRGQKREKKRWKELFAGKENISIAARELFRSGRSPGFRFFLLVP